MVTEQKMFLSILMGFLIIFSTKSEIITYSDGSVNADFQVECSDNMSAFFNLTQLTSRTTIDTNRPFRIEFSGQSSDPLCGVDDTNTTLIDTNFRNGKTKFRESIELSAILQNGVCGINVFADNDNIIYNQTLKVTYGTNVGIIQREEYDYYNVMCLRNRTVEVEEQGGGYNVTHRQTGFDEINNTAPFTLTLTHTLKSGASQTLYKVGDIIRFRVQTITTSNVKAVIQNCWATSDGTSNRYNLITDRCISDPGTKFEEQDSKSSKFDTEAFRFTGLSSSTVYVECTVRICLATVSVGECQHCFVIGGRKRRSVDSSSDKDKVLAQVRSPGFYVIVEDKSQPDQVRKKQLQEDGPHQVLFSTNQGKIIIILLFTIVFVVIVKFLKDSISSSNKTKVVAGRQYDRLA